MRVYAQRLVCLFLCWAVLLLMQAPVLAQFDSAPAIPNEPTVIEDQVTVVDDTSNTENNINTIEIIDLVESGATNTTPDQTDLLDVAVTTEVSDEENPSVESSDSTIKTISEKLFSLFVGQETYSTAVAEVIPVYDLQQTISLKAKPYQAIVISDSTPTATGLIETVIETVVDWFTTDTVINDVSDSDTLPSDTIDNPPTTDDTENPTPPIPQETEIPETSWWGNLVYADELEIPVPVLEAVEETKIVDTSVDIATSTSGTIEATTTVYTEATTTATTTTEIINSYWARVGTTSLTQASLVPATVDGEIVYYLNIPPGALALGLHEIMISTTTVHGEINERFVVDIGGGATRHYFIDDYLEVVVITSEEGQESLWLSHNNNQSFTYKLIADFGAIQNHSPLSVFDGVIFYLDQTGQSIVSYDLVSQSVSSLGVDDGVSQTIILPSGLYYIDFNETEFLFISEAPAVY